jgi:hypothetical protein
MVIISFFLRKKNKVYLGKQKHKFITLEVNGNNLVVIRD